MWSKCNMYVYVLYYATPSQISEIFLSSSNYICTMLLQTKSKTLILPSRMNKKYDLKLG